MVVLVRVLDVRGEDICNERWLRGMARYTDTSVLHAVINQSVGLYFRVYGGQIDVLFVRVMLYTTQMQPALKRTGHT